VHEKAAAQDLVSAPHQFAAPRIAYFFLMTARARSRSIM
jgi:hypothetical protein